MTTGYHFWHTRTPRELTEVTVCIIRTGHLCHVGIVPARVDKVEKAPAEVRKWVPHRLHFSGKKWVQVTRSKEERRKAAGFRASFAEALYSSLDLSREHRLGNNAFTINLRTGKTNVEVTHGAEFLGELKRLVSTQEERNLPSRTETMDAYAKAAP